MGRCSITTRRSAITLSRHSGYSHLAEPSAEGNATSAFASCQTMANSPSATFSGTVGVLGSNHMAISKQASKQAKQSKAKQSKAKQSKAKQSKAKQSKAKQSKALKHSSTQALKHSSTQALKHSSTQASQPRMQTSGKATTRQPKTQPLEKWQAMLYNAFSQRLQDFKQNRKHWKLVARRRPLRALCCPTKPPEAKGPYSS